jgi:hypothetical protein
MRVGQLWLQLQVPTTAQNDGSPGPNHLMASHGTTMAVARGKAACVAKRMTKQIRNREAWVTELQLA